MALKQWIWSSLCIASLAAQTVLGKEPPRPAAEAKTPSAKPQKPAAAGKALPALDAEFLEFLANWDSEDETWNEYLASLRADEGGAKPDDKRTGKDGQAPTDKAAEPTDSTESAQKTKGGTMSGKTSDTVKKVDDNG